MYNISNICLGCCVQSLKFLTFPYLLTIHLLRFDFDYNTFRRIKLNHRLGQIYCHWTPDTLFNNFVL